MENNLLKFLEENKETIENFRKMYSDEETQKRQERLSELLEIFDYEQYKKDIEKLNELTSKILKNNAPQKQEPNFKNDEKEKNIRMFGDNWVGKKLSKEIVEKSKEKIENDLPAIIKNLDKLGLYRCYAVSDNKFNASYLDMVELNSEEKEEETKDDTVYKMGLEGSFDSLKRKKIGVKLFNFVGRMNERFVSLENKSIDVGIKDFINDHFIKKVKEIAEKNTVDEKTKFLKEPLDITKDESINKISNKIYGISNYIGAKSKRGAATFILASKKNIELILEVTNHWKLDGKTFKYNEGNLNLIVNDDLEDTVIVGRKPNEGDPGINLVVNRNTLTNFTYSEEDVSGVNLSFDFFAIGQHPEYNYFSFEIKR